MGRHYMASSVVLFLKARAGSVIVVDLLAVLLVEEEEGVTDK